MTNWRKINQTWCSWPSKPKALIEMIGGSYLAASPNITYKRLLERLVEKNIAIHAWSYIPGLDHQAQANEAWKEFRQCRLKLESRIGETSYNPIRLGHSLGCKLHLIAPDGGRKSKSFIGLSFNNYKADKSIPILSKVKKRLNFETEFSPSPIETISIIVKNYLQKQNLLIKFSNDNLDQTSLLLENLKKRHNDDTRVIEISGNHLTPATQNIKDYILTDKLESNNQNNNLNTLVNTIYNYIME